MDERGQPVSGCTASNVLNLHYAIVEETLPKKFNKIKSQIVTPQMPLPYDSMKFRFVNITEICSLIKLLKNDKPSGMVHLRTDILKDALKSYQ